jgi:hypothetical protein
MLEVHADPALLPLPLFMPSSASAVALAQVLAAAVVRSGGKAVGLAVDKNIGQVVRAGDEADVGWLWRRKVNGA